MRDNFSFRLGAWPVVVAAGLLAGAMVNVVGCDAHTAAEPSAQAATISAAPIPSAAPQPNASQVQGAKPFMTTGPLVAAQQADLAAERDGVVMKIDAQLGDHVQRGQVLASLDDRLLVAACDEQKARIVSLQAQVKEWQSEQQVEQADLRRAEALHADKILSEEDFDHVKYKLDETMAEVARYHADEAAAAASLQTANLLLGQSRVVAPFAGVVGRSSPRVAQEVKKGDVLFWITAVDPLRVLFTVPESAMAQFRSGAALELTTADYPELRQSARVYRVSPVVDPASGSVQVIGEVVRPSPLLKPGMTMQVQAMAQQRAGVPKTP